MLNEANLVVDAENLLIETEIQDVDDLNVDTDLKENLIATPVTADPITTTIMPIEYIIDSGIQIMDDVIVDPGPQQIFVAASAATEQAARTVAANEQTTN
ncbi:hypothetical protein Tco_1116181, partial [Tanacetum coccineum]